MVMRLATMDSDFEARFSALLGQKREISEDVDATVRAIIADVRARGDAALVDYTHRFDRLELSPGTLRIAQDEISRSVAACDPQTLKALALARDRIRSHHERQMPKDDRYTDALGVELGSRWTAVESVGPLRSRRHGKLSKFGADERSARCRGGRRTHRHGGSLARRRAESAGAGGRASCRRQRDLPHRRRAGGRGAGLRHANDCPGRQDRRPRQCLCGGRQAAGIRHGGHRHDRRSLGSAGDRRRRQRPGMDRRRSSGAGRARRLGAVDPHHRFASVWR